ncbi:MAG: hypothetical protein KME15_08105 [Drouetiella hepatica Uher 2000/2452]|uniref:Uncharacterized protein n=1 Tax=Drouetiella hepatica Uher 2000/2452 TaxID=904376 RepID=A0A951Q9C6_9CYAN|nr:hypothetical protein [Drouetiella hepatica Uher 2000/2452]
MSFSALVPTLLAIVILILLYLLLREIGRRSRSPRGTSRSVRSRQPRSPRLGSASPASRRRLLRLVNGNEKTAIRLVSNLKETHPERSEQWCWEKAIYDLERDRRA